MVGASRDRLLGIALATSILAASPLGELRAAGFSPPPGAAAPTAPPPVEPIPPPAAATAAPAAAPTASIPAAVDPEIPGQAPSPAPAVRAAPRLDASGKPRQPLYRRWAFWTIAGALVISAAAITYAASRPAPSPYYGNLSPQVIYLP
jgi:hypothetical protein